MKSRLGQVRQPKAARCRWRQKEGARKEKWAVISEKGAKVLE